MGFWLYALGAVILVAPEIADKLAGAGMPVSTPSPVTTAAPALERSAATTALTTSPPTVAPATPSPSPTASRDPMVVRAYVNGGRRFAALSLPRGYTVASPISGRASVAVYQFLGGDVRVGSNVPSEPFFPYITITSAEGRVVLRPGALGRDVQLTVKDGQAVVAGAPLFTIVGDGASSWRTFYDRSVTAQVIASAAALPSGAELDPIPLFRR